MKTETRSPPRPLCSEPGCDREPASGDARCALHASRLGPMPAVFEADAVLAVPAEGARPESRAPTMAAPVTTAGKTGDWSDAAFVAGVSIVAYFGASLFTLLFELSGDRVPTSLTVVALLAMLVGPVAGVVAVRRARRLGARLVSVAVTVAASVPAVRVLLSFLS